MENAILLKIKKKRLEQGYSQECMAHQLGITSSTYGKIERGETKLDIDRFKQIADVLETDVMDLLSEDHVFIAYNGDYSANVNSDVAIKSYYSNKNQKVWERVMKHMEEEIATLRQEKEQLIKVIEQLTAK